MSYFLITGAGLLIAFIIHAAYSLVLHDGSPGPYPMPVQALVGIFVFLPPMLGLFYGPATMFLGKDPAFLKD